MQPQEEGFAAELTEPQQEAEADPAQPGGAAPFGGRITSYNVCYTKLLRAQINWTKFRSDTGCKG